MFCAPCAHVEAHGWWGQKGTHCRGCHLSWHSLTESHCTRCHQHFSADSVADLHEPYCSPDPVVAAESLRGATKANGNLIFDQRTRKDGLVWITWDARPHPKTVLV